MKAFLLILLFINTCLFAVTPDTSSEILCIFKFENTIQDTLYNDFNLYLAGKLEKELTTGLILKSLPISFNDFFRNDTTKRLNIRISLLGRFEYGKDSLKTLKFKIMDVKSNVEQEKTISLSYMEKEDIAQIVMLKLRNFLEQSMLGRLNITSIPLGLPILLDQKSAGITPKEFFLRSGNYSLELRGQYLVPYREDIEVSPGKTINIRADMEFKGYPTRLWLLGAVVATWEMMVILVLENNYYSDYKNAPSGTPISRKNASYDKYRNIRSVRLTLLGTSGIGWIGAGYCFFSNKIIKNRYFNKTSQIQ